MTHNHFKIFTGKLDSVKELTSKAEAFAASEQVSARSIGIEYVESSSEIVLSLGYSKDNDHKAISLIPVNLGVVDFKNAGHIESLMSEAASKQQNVICHELLITHQNELMMMFMCTK